MMAARFCRGAPEGAIDARHYVSAAAIGWVAQMCRRPKFGPRQLSRTGRFLKSPRTFVVFIVLVLSSLPIKGSGSERDRCVGGVGLEGKKEKEVREDEEPDKVSEERDEEEEDKEGERGGRMKRMKSEGKGEEVQEQEQEQEEEEEEGTAPPRWVM